MKRPVLKFSVELLVFIVLLAVSGLLLKPVTVRLGHALERSRDTMTEALEQITGLRFTYRTLSPSILSSIKLADLVLTSAANGATIAKIQKVELKYNLIDLLFGNFDTAFSSITLENGFVDADLVSDPELLNRLKTLFDGSAGPGAGASLAVSEPVGIRIRNLELRYTEPNRQALVHIRKGGATITSNEIIFDFSTSVSYSQALLKDSGPILADIRLSGSVNSALDTGSASLIFNTVETNQFEISRINLFASLQDGVLSLASVQDLQPVDIRLEWDIAAQDLQVNLECDRLLPLQWLQFKDQLPALAAFQYMQLSGIADLLWTADEGLVYQADFKAALPELESTESGLLRLSLTGNDTRFEIHNFTAVGKSYDFSWVGGMDIQNLLPDGYVSVNRLRLPKGALISFEAYLPRTDESGSLVCLIPELRLDDTVFNSIECAILRKGSAVDFSLSAGHSGSDENVNSGSISVEGSVSLGDAPFIQAYVAFDSMSVLALSTTASAVLSGQSGVVDSTVSRFLSDYALTTEIYLSTNLQNISWNCTRLVMASPVRDGFYILLSAKGTESDMELTDLAFSRPGVDASGSLTLFFADQDDVLLDASLVVNLIPYNFGAQYSQGIITVSGDYGLTASVLLATSGDVTGTLALSSFPLNLGGYTLAASLNSSFHSSAVEGWGISFRDGSVEEIGGKLESEPRLSFRGNADPNGIFFDQLLFSDRISNLSGTAGLALLPGEPESYQYALDIALATSDRKESYRIEASAVNNGELFLQGRVDVTGSPLMRFLPRQQRDNIFSGVVTVSGTPQELLGGVDLQSFVYRLGGFNLTMGGKLRLEEGVLSCADVSASWNGHTLSSLAGEFKPVNGAGSLTASYYGALGTAGITSKVELELETATHLPPEFSFNDFLDKPDMLSDLFSNFSLVAGFDEATWNEVTAAKEIVCTFIREPGITAFYAGDRDDFSGFLMDDGTFSMQAGSKLPLTFTADGSIRNAQIDITVSDFGIQLPQFWPLLGLDLAAFDDGLLTGSFRISGLLNDPEFDGTFASSDIKVRSPGYLGEVYGPVELSASASGKTITVAPFILRGRNGEINARAVFEFDRWVPALITLNAYTSEKKPVRLLSDTPLFKATGYASFDIKLVATPGLIAVDGSALFERGSFAILFNQLGQSQDSIAIRNSDLIVNLALSFGNKVEFRWPNDDLPIIRALVQATEPMQLILDTSRDLFQFKGSASLRGGEIFYIKRNFYLRQGTIVFNENQDRFDPLITLLAEIRERDQEGKPVRIYMDVSAQPLSLFTPFLRSDPAKSEAEIMALLGQDLQELFSRESGARTAIVVASDIFTQMGLFRAAENRVRDALNLDIFSVRTLIIQNAILGPTIQNSTATKMTFGNYFDNTTVYMGKYLGSAIYADALMHFSYYDNKSPEVLGNEPGVYGNLLFQPELGLEVTTPFFLLRWGFSPRHPETLFVSDNSVTLSWKLAY